MNCWKAEGLLRAPHSHGARAPRPVPALNPNCGSGKISTVRSGSSRVINCRGTYTILSGSTTLPEVKRAMDEASRHYVNLDELMEGVGRRLAELTKAQWGIVTAGCSAAETLATCACVAGTSPEKMQRIPNLHGMKNEVVIPRYSRNVYDHGVRMAGVKMVTVDSLEQFEAALTPQTAMVYVLACPADTGPLGLQPIAQIARRKGVPVFVDAAAENLTPEIHLSRGSRPGGIQRRKGYSRTAMRGTAARTQGSLSGGLAQ